MYPLLNISNDVIIGANSNLFLANGGHNCLDYLTGKRPLPEISFKNLATNIKKRDDLVSQSGAIFKHIIFPDKHAVCVDDFPISNPILLAHQFMIRFQEWLPQVTYLRDVLIAQDRPTFMRTDTHLNAHGTAVSAVKIAEFLTDECLTTHLQCLIKDISIEFITQGDLGSKLEPKQSSVEFRNPAKWIEYWIHNNVVGGNNGMMSVLFNSHAIFDKRVVFFGDSFGNSVCHFLSYFFKEIVFFRSPFFHFDLFWRIKPDYVVTQNIERYLENINLDNDAKDFFSYPIIANDSYSPSSAFQEALTAVLNFDTNLYYDFLNKIVHRKI